MDLATLSEGENVSRRDMVSMYLEAQFKRGGEVSPHLNQAPSLPVYFCEICSFEPSSTQSTRSCWYLALVVRAEAYNPSRSDRIGYYLSPR